jgi:tetratricopeptide (TPR) repeat protein
LVTCRLALSFLNEDMLMQLGDFHLAKAMDVKRPVLLNIAACQLRLEDFHAAIASCSEVLAEQPRNAKALFRRGKARRALGQSEAAAADLAAAQDAEPGDAAVARELAAVQRELKQVGEPALPPRDCSEGKERPFLPLWVQKMAERSSQ